MEFLFVLMIIIITFHFNFGLDCKSVFTILVMILTTYANCEVFIYFTV